MYSRSVVGALAGAGCVVEGELEMLSLVCGGCRWVGKLGDGGVVGWRGRLGETTGVGMDPHTIIKYWDAGLGQEGMKGCSEG